MVELSGFFFNNAGTAVSGVNVSVFNRNTVSCAVTTTTTNACGFWTRSGIAEGRYDVQFVCGSATSRIKYDDEVQLLELEAATFKIRNPADTFVYDIVPAAILANRTLNLPLITGTDTLVSEGVARTFTADMSFNDNVNLTLGTGGDVDLDYNGTDLVLNLTVVGSGDFVVNGGSIEFDDNEGLTLGAGKDVTFRYNGTDTTLNLQAVGSGALMIALGACPPAPDGNAVHIFEATAGSVTACATSLLVLETNCEGNITFLTPNCQPAGILFGDPQNSAIGKFQYLHACNDFLWTANTTAHMRLTDAGLLKIGDGLANRACTEGTNQLAILNGTAPTGNLTNGASFYAACGEMNVIDSTGNVTLLSPHDLETGEWVFDSRDSVTGKGIHVRMEEMMKRLCDEFGWGLVTEYPETEC